MICSHNSITVMEECDMFYHDISKRRFDINALWQSDDTWRNNSWSKWAQAMANSTGKHCNDVIMSAMVFPITSLTIVYSTVYSGANQRKHQSSASLAFVRGIHRWPVNSSHKRPVTRKMSPFDDVIHHECSHISQVPCSQIYILTRLLDSDSTILFL